MRDLSDDEAARELARVEGVQPALSEFVGPFFSEMSPEAMSLGLPIYVAIVRMFEKHFGKRLQSVSPEPLESLLAKDVLSLDNLIGPGKRASLMPEQFALH